MADDDPTARDPLADTRTWGRVQRVFHEARELAPAARDAFLAKLDVEDPAVASEVRSLLVAHDESSGFLAASPASRLLRVVAPGDRLGPYRILEEIGRGGMGVVYRAVRDDESFTKEVAIKLIEPGMRSDEILRRFHAERRIQAMLDHPHIARLIDGGTAPDGSPYLVMDHVAGKPLLDDCDERKLGVDERLALFLQVCDAVQFAHQRLVVHRDLKSDNILVTADGSPRLLDFGIAKLLAPEGGEAQMTVTAPMHRLLTPDYASPEQVRGEPATVAGDVYSLGVILYELLSGSRPFRFTTRSPEEILRVVTHEDAPPPSTIVARSDADVAANRRGQTTRSLRRRLAGDLDFIVLQALEKDPARRYGSVDQLAQDIRRHLAGHPVLARGQSTVYLMSRFVRRHRAAVVTTAVILLSLVVGLAGTIWQANVATRERDRAKRRFEDVRSLAHAVIFDLHDAIEKLPGSTRAREALVEHALRYLDRLNAEAHGDASLQHELALAYAKIGDVQGRPMFSNLGRSSDALRSYDQALGLLREATQARPDSTDFLHDLIVVSQRKTDLLGVLGRHDEAMREALASLDRIQRELAKRPNDPLFLTDLTVAFGRLSDMKLVAADTAGAIAANVRNVEINERMFHENPKDPAARRGAFVALAKRANLLAMRGQRDSALASYLRAEELAREAVAVLPNDTEAKRDLSICYGLRGLFIAEGGAVDSGLAVYMSGQAIAEQLAAADPDNALQQSDVADGNYEIGTMLMKAGRFEAAEQRFGDAFARYVRMAAADTGNTSTRTSMARSSRGAGEACQALMQSARSPDQRSRARARALTWFERSRELYAGLANTGALVGEDATAPKQVDQLVADLRKIGDGSR